MPVNFQPFDKYKAVRIYHRHLPHWRQEGANYFVTFRLHDALPHHCIQYLEQLREALAKTAERDDLWLEADRHYFEKMKGYLEAGYGECWLSNVWAHEIIASAMHHFDGARYELGEYAIMPNHVHVLVRPMPAHELEDLLHSWKSYTSSEINRQAGRKGRLWQDETYDRLVRDSAELVRTEAYIRRNREGRA